MNRDVLESQWTQVREILREKFSNLTDEDIRQINGRYDQLVAKLQQKYGYSREEAEDRIRSWNFDRFAGAKAAPAGRAGYEDKRIRREESSDLWKWILGLGIPLLLLATYFLSSDRMSETRAQAPVVTQEQMATETPADRAISANLRSFFTSQQALASEMQNVQITTRDGVVTLSGTVSNRDVRDAIEARAENISGVRQVINNLQVR